MVPETREDVVTSKVAKIEIEILMVNTIKLKQIWRKDRNK